MATCCCTAGGEQEMNVLGLDIGGANLKAAHVNGAARLQPFALWKNPQGLPQALGELVRAMPDADTLAVTMTGELCDCFETKRQGVHYILDAVESVAGERRVVVFRTDGSLVKRAEARTAPLQAAAANWLALAIYAGREFASDGPALLFDIGSTTTDIVPLWNGVPIPAGRTDAERLRHGELVYLGVRRTPLYRLLSDGYAAELFATTLDAFLLDGRIPEDAADCQTADGRPATRSAAHARVARMMCADVETCSLGESEGMARSAVTRMIDFLVEAVGIVARRLQMKPRTVVLAGSGEFLGRAVLDLQTAFSPGELISLSRRLGPEISQAACAYAVAMLAREYVR
jgi:probable H4MPT-linked C1 transfer pathway protein